MSTCIELKLPGRRRTCCECKGDQWTENHGLGWESSLLLEKKYAAESKRADNDQQAGQDLKEDLRRGNR